MTQYDYALDYSYIREHDWKVFKIIEGESPIVAKGIAGFDDEDDAIAFVNWKNSQAQDDEPTVGCGKTICAREGGHQGGCNI